MAGTLGSISARLAGNRGVCPVDLFSDALAALRTGSPVATVTQASAPWGLRFPAVAGAGFHVTLHGSCVLLPPDGDPIRLREGDVVFLRKGSQHTLTSDPGVLAQDFSHERVDQTGAIGRIVVDGPGEQVVLVCGAYRLDLTRPHPFGNLPAVIHLPGGPDQYPALRTSIQQLTAELDNPRPGSDSIVTALIDLMLLHIIRAWYETLPAEQTNGWTAALADPALEPALRAIHAEPGRPWTVDELSRKSGLSRAAFARRFAAAVGEPPLGYLTSWRMTTAGRLLRETDLSLAAVAERTGYSTEFALAKAFKREFGEAPGSYRRRARATMEAIASPALPM
jgi:AraC-like DNA-binding protein